MPEPEHDPGSRTASRAGSRTGGEVDGERTRHPTCTAAADAALRRALSGHPGACCARTSPFPAVPSTPPGDRARSSGSRPSTHVPGLPVCVPATAQDAQELTLGGAPRLPGRDVTVLTWAAVSTGFRRAARAPLRGTPVRTPAAAVLTQAVPPSVQRTARAVEAAAGGGQRHAPRLRDGARTGATS